MFNFDFLENGLGIVSLPHFVYENCFQHYIPLTDQISLSNCFYFLIYWAICVLQMFLSQAVKLTLSLSDRNGTGTHNHLVRKRTLNHLANGWVFIYELSGCGFESRCSHLNCRYRTCFE